MNDLHTPPVQPDLVVSGLQAEPAEAASRPALLAGGPDDSVFYVSMPVGTDSGGGLAIVQNLRTGQRLEISVVDGGFTPVALSGVVGDTVVVSTGTTLRRMVVPDSRPPVVVRSEPPKKKTDVPLNAFLLVYFSEPVDGGSITPPSIHLLQGTSTVSGSVRFADSTHLSVEFAPDAPLASNSSYQLVVTTEVSGGDGSALAHPDTIPFTTGSSYTGSPASIRLGASLLQVPGTYQLTPTVRDAAGNILTGVPITWLSSDTLAIAISQSGLLSALTAGGGFYSVAATIPGCCSDAIDSVDLLRSVPPASVAIVSPANTLSLGDTLRIKATVRDAAGRLLNSGVAWSSTPPGTVTIAPQYSPYDTAIALVTAAAQGASTITATAGSASGGLSLTINPPRSVSTVTVYPDTATLLVQGSVQLSAVLYDSTNRPIPPGLVAMTWTSDNTGIATVDANGLVTGVAGGVAQIVVSSEGHSDTSSITVQTVNLATIAVGLAHSCGVSAGGATYCWGWNSNGQLGDDEIAPSSTPVVVHGSFAFVPSSLTLGGDHACALTAAGSAYCWGSNGYGELGDAVDNQYWPIPDVVLGGLTFSVLSAGMRDTCGLTTSSQAYCWGDDTFGQLGDSSSVEEMVPVAVAGGLTYTKISVGGDHTCGLAAGGVAYCWGANDHGQLGDSSEVPSAVPVAVAGGHTFITLNAGSAHTCAIATDGTAYCWGLNSEGQLGTGSFVDNPAPVPVSWGQAFTSISAGQDHTCGLAAGVALCWGGNVYGQLGNGSTNTSATPLGVTGGISFSTLNAGSTTTCGLSTGGVAYCWGYNGWGALGNGSYKDSAVPVKVSGQP